MDEANLDFSVIAANPYYATNFASHAFIQHSSLGSAEDWVAANASLIKDIGSKNWLNELLDVLSLSRADYDGHDIINPALVININNSHSGKHETIITGDQWIEVNAKLIDEMGIVNWLWKLLEVLNNNLSSK
jgi:hypothetical protein